MNRMINLQNNNTLNPLDITRSRANLTVGAENTKTTTVFRLPSRGRITYIRLNAGSSAEYKTRSRGICAGRFVVRFFQLPGGFSIARNAIGNRLADINSALKKRKTTKGTSVFSARIFGVPVKYPQSKILNPLDITRSRANLNVGANNTTRKRFPTPVVKSGYLYQALMPGVAGNKTPALGNTCWPTFYGFVSCPALFSYPDSMRKVSAEKNTALEKRSKTKGTQVFLHPFFGVPMLYPQSVSVGSPITAEGVAA